MDIAHLLSVVGLIYNYMLEPRTIKTEEKKRKEKERIGKRGKRS
jgi:hypothetical protein